MYLRQEKSDFPLGTEEYLKSLEKGLQCLAANNNEQQYSENRATTYIYRFCSVLLTPLIVRSRHGMVSLEKLLTQMKEDIAQEQEVHHLAVQLTKNSHKNSSLVVNVDLYCPMTVLLI